MSYVESRTSTPPTDMVSTQEQQQAHPAMASSSITLLRPLSGNNASSSKSEDSLPVTVHPIMSQDILLPFLDRPQEVDTLIFHTHSNRHLASRLRATLDDQHGNSRLLHLLRTPREHLADFDWLRSLYAHVVPQDESLWVHLAACLGADGLHLDLDDIEHDNAADPSAIHAVHSAETTDTESSEEEQVCSIRALDHVPDSISRGPFPPNQEHDSHTRPREDSRGSNHSRASSQRSALDNIAEESSANVGSNAPPARPPSTDTPLHAGLRISVGSGGAPRSDTHRRTSSLETNDSKASPTRSRRLSSLLQDVRIDTRPSSMPARLAARSRRRHSTAPRLELHPPPTRSGSSGYFSQGHRRAHSIDAKTPTGPVVAPTTDVESQEPRRRRALSFARSFGDLSITPSSRLQAKRASVAKTAVAKDLVGSDSQRPFSLTAMALTPANLAMESELCGVQKSRDLGLLPDGRTRHPSAGSDGGSSRPGSSSDVIAPLSPLENKRRYSATVMLSAGDVATPLAREHNAVASEGLLMKQPPISDFELSPARRWGSEGHEAYTEGVKSFRKSLGIGGRLGKTWKLPDEKATLRDSSLNMGGFDLEENVVDSTADADTSPLPMAKQQVSKSSTALWAGELYGQNSALVSNTAVKESGTGLAVGGGLSLVGRRKSSDESAGYRPQTRNASFPAESTASHKRTGSAESFTRRLSNRANVQPKVASPNTPPAADLPSDLAIDTALARSQSAALEARHAAAQHRARQDSNASFTTNRSQSIASDSSYSIPTPNRVRSISSASRESETGLHSGLFSPLWSAGSGSRCATSSEGWSSWPITPPSSAHSPTLVKRQYFASDVKSSPVPPPLPAGVTHTESSAKKSSSSPGSSCAPSAHSYISQSGRLDASSTRVFLLPPGASDRATAFRTLLRTDQGREAVQKAREVLGSESAAKIVHLLEDVQREEMNDETLLKRVGELCGLVDRSHDGLTKLAESTAREQPYSARWAVFQGICEALACPSTEMAIMKARAGPVEHPDRLQAA